MSHPTEKDWKSETPITLSLSRIQSQSRSSCIPVSAVSTPEAPVILHGRDECRDIEGDRISFHSCAPTHDVEKCPGPVECTSMVLGIDNRGSSTSSITHVDEDPNLVEWEGDDDPSHPQNWKRRRKWIAIALVSAFTFMSPVSSSILAPSLADIGRDLNITSESERALCLSIFVLGFAFGPLLFAPLSELYGRSIVLQLSNIIYIIFNGACGFATTKAQFIIFRLFGGIGGSASLAIGPAMMSDLFSADERGLVVSIYAFFPMLGPAIGPICGGFITEYSTWRWGFWATTITALPILLLGVFFLEETYPAVLLQRKKKRLICETGNTRFFTGYEDPDQTLARRLSHALTRPMRLMSTQIIIIVMGLYQAYLYSLMYIVLATFPPLWTKHYHQSVSIAGLNYISLGLGYCVGIQISSHVQDSLYRVLKRRNNGVGLPEFRVPLLLPVAIILPLGFFMYGWTAQNHTHWIFPNIGAFIFAAGIMVGFNALMTYVVDSYPTYAASAAAATTVLRSVAAFILPLFAPAMYEALGYGWGNSLLAFLALGIGLPAPALLWYHGEKLRARSTFASG